MEIIAVIPRLDQFGSGWVGTKSGKNYAMPTQKTLSLVCSSSFPIRIRFAANGVSSCRPLADSIFSRFAMEAWWLESLVRTLSIFRLRPDDPESQKSPR